MAELTWLGLVLMEFMLVLRNRCQAQVLHPTIKMEIVRPEKELFPRTIVMMDEGRVLADGLISEFWKMKSC
jgi:hypothetical protein